MPLPAPKTSPEGPIYYPAALFAVPCPLSVNSAGNPSYLTAPEKPFGLTLSGCICRSNNVLYVLSLLFPWVEELGCLRNRLPDGAVPHASRPLLAVARLTRDVKNALRVIKRFA